VNDRSLRVGLLSRLGPVLVLLLALDAVACYLTALHFANLVYDRWLIDSTRSLAQVVRPKEGQVEVDLPRAAVQIFQFDEVDSTYFKITSARRGFLAGEARLPSDESAPINGIALADATLDDRSVRVVATRLVPPQTDDTVTVVIAETLNKRTSLAREIVLAMVAPQVALVGITTLLAWLGVSHGLKPLTELASQIEARDQNNLSPVPQTALPREARVLATRINELLARLGSALRAQKRFVADAAHQLRTPLAAVMLQTERAQRAPNEADAREALNALHRSVERAARLCQQLLSLARAEPEAVTAVQFKPVDLVALARRVGEEWIPRALKRDVDFGLIAPDTPVHITGDERLLSEALSNLIDNALRYGKPAGRVSVIVEDGPQPKLAVQDDGPGIPEDERVRIFERFYRIGDATGDGCGLGLAIVDEIARLHSSTVEVGTGSDGQGARFTVVFTPAPSQTVS
jgi:two-component system sensor histidine kinase TctE